MDILTLRPEVKWMVLAMNYTSKYADVIQTNIRCRCQILDIIETNGFCNHELSLMKCRIETNSPKTDQTYIATANVTFNKHDLWLSPSKQAKKNKSPPNISHDCMDVSADSLKGKPSGGKLQTISVFLRSPAVLVI